MNDDRVTWRASVSYDFAQSVTGYVTASTGFKSGGFTMRITERNTRLPRFGPESIDLYEIGLKTQLPALGLRLNTAAFWSNYDDIQRNPSFGIATFVQAAGRRARHAPEETQHAGRRCERASSRARFDRFDTRWRRKVYGICHPAASAGYAGRQKFRTAASNKKRW